METKKQIIKRIVFGFLVIVWMITIFCFSSEQSDKSTDTSGNTIKTVLSRFEKFNKLEQEDQQKLIENLQHPIRKLAHFTIYTIGGMLIFNFINTYKIINKKKIMFTIMFGALYAVTDEIHQLFIPGRSGQISDVIIDACGVIIGCTIIYFSYKIRIKK